MPNISKKLYFVDKATITLGSNKSIWVWDESDSVRHIFNGSQTLCGIKVKGVDKGWFKVSGDFEDLITGHTMCKICSGVYYKYK